MITINEQATQVYNELHEREKAIFINSLESIMSQNELDPKKEIELNAYDKKGNTVVTGLARLDNGKLHVYQLHFSHLTRDN